MLAALLTLALAQPAQPAQAAPPAPAARRTENVILVTYDGLRWEEVFSGADPALLAKKEGGVKDVEALRAKYWRETPEARREALLPFLWGVVAKDGQLFGNGPHGSVARVTNGLNFSYPGYQELLAGWPDPAVDSNDKVGNRNVTVLEWLNGKDAFRGRVAAFSQWDCFAWILNRERSGLLVNAGPEPLSGEGLSERERTLSGVVGDTNWPDADQRSDALTYLLAEAYFERAKPRVLYLAFGETDHWAHEGRYDLVLEGAHRTDGYLARLWAAVQASPQHAGKTSLVITTDHGRGGAPTEWKGHGKKIPASDRIWLAVLGPDTPALGERRDCGEVLQSQVASTVAALLGEDWTKAEPRAAPPVADALAK